MSKFPAYSKIFAVGSDRIPDLFKGEVEVTEKIDGSLFALGLDTDGQVIMRTKGEQTYFESYQKMFEKAVDWTKQNEEKIQKTLQPNTYVYGEFLTKPCHNVLNYERTPKNHIIVFAVRVGENWIKKYDKIKEIAESLGLEAVPLLYQGVVDHFGKLEDLLKTKSGLGNEDIEGFVVKNYDAPCFIGNMVLPSLGKFVREAFKERHQKEWRPKFSFSDKMDQFIESFRAEARWQKAIQHLKEKGELEFEPRDIGKLMKEIKEDIFEEEAEYIKNFLFGHFSDRIARRATAGFAEWYKEFLAKRAFEEKEEVNVDSGPQ